MNRTIKVIDALPGTGKTHALLEQLKAKGTHFVYVTPLLSETERVMEQVPNTAVPHGLKSIDFHRLLLEGYNIATTHSLFMMLSDVVIGKDTVLVIDEALDCIEKFDIVHGELQDMLHRHLHSDETGKLYFTGNKDEYEPTSVQYTLIEYCSRGVAYLINNNVVIIELSPEVLQQFRTIYVLTYNFNHSLFALWIKKQGYSTEEVTIPLLKSNEQVIETMKQCIEIVSIPDIEEHNYSYTGWITTMKKELSSLRKSLLQYVEENDIDDDKVLYTCPLEFKNRIKPRGYKGITWLACRTKATNDYAHCTEVWYLYDRYYNPGLQMFANKYGFELNNDEYAKTELIQFIFRSALRKDEKIRLVIPSLRMRNLLNKFLGLPIEKAKPKRRKLTEDDIIHIVAAREIGDSVANIAKRHKVSTRQIYRILKAQ